MKAEQLEYIDYSGLPESLKEAIKIYLEYGIDPGSFLTAVIDNNLRESFAYADEGNRFLLFHIVSWFYNKAPSDCWGSIEKRIAWQKEQDKNMGASG